MTDQKRQALNDLYQQLNANRIPYSHNFLRCIAQSQEALQAVLQSSNEQTLNQMLAGARNSLEHALNNNIIRPNHRAIVDGAIATINRELGTTVVPFDQEIRAIYTIIGQPTNERARFCNEAGINQKFHAYGIVNGAQFTVLQNNPALVERFLRLCEATGCSPAVVASFREVLLPNTRINQTNSPQTRAAVIAAMRQDPVFEERIVNTAYRTSSQRDLLQAYLDGLRDDVTDAEHIRYREGLYDIYYLPFLQRTGRLQNQNWHQNKTDFFASVECQRYIDEIIRPDFDRFNRITNLRNRNAGIYQNGGRLTGTGDATGVEFSPTPDSIEVKQNPRVSYDVNSNANNSLKTIDVRDDTDTSIGTFRSNEKVPLDVLRRADRVVGTVGVQPQVSMKSLLNNATVAFQAPEEDVTVEMNRDQINNLLASVDPGPTITPAASLAVGGPSVSVPITTDNIMLSGTGEPGRNIEVSVSGTALPVVTVESDGSWQVPVTGLTAGSVNIQTRMRDAAGTGREPSVHRLYTCTYVAPGLTIETPTMGDFIKRTGVAGAQVPSQALRVTNLTRPATVAVGGGEYRIDGGGWTSTAGTITNGQMLEVRGTALPTVGDVEVVTINVGAITKTYEVETIDTVTPPAEYPVFAPQAKTNVAVSTPVESDPFDVTGITRPTTARCTGGEMSIDGGLSWTPAGTDLPVPVGAQMILRTTSSAAHNTRTACSVDIGGVVKSFFVTTEVAPTTAPLVFSEPVGSRIDGNTSTKALFGGTAPQNLSGGTIDVRDIAGAIVLTENNLQTTATGLRNREIDFAGLPTGRYTVRVALGTQTQDKTMEYTAPIRGPETPDDFPFPRKDDVALSVVGGATNTVESKPVQIANITRPTEVRCANGEFTVDGGATWHPAGTLGIMVQPNGFLQVRIAASTEYAEETIATVAVGTKSSDFIVKTIDEPEILELPTITEPGAWVFSNNPVIVKGTAKNDSFVELSDSTGRTLGRVKAVGGEWTLTVGRFPVGDHIIRAVACDDHGTPDPTRFTEITFEVGEVGLQNVTATREEINAVVYGETGKQVTIGYRKQGETTWNERSEMMTTSPQTFTRLGLDLTHGTYEVQMKQGTIESTDTFTINAYRVLPDMGRLPRSQDRNPIFYGTAEPNEELTINYKIPGTDEEKEIKVDTDGAGERSFTLPDTITGVYDLKLSCAGEKHTINYTSEGVSRKPIIDNDRITIKNSDDNFTLSGFIDRRDLDCESVAVFDGDTEIARVPLGKFSMKNRITRHRSTNSAFSATIAANHIDSDSSKVFTIKPVRQGGVVDDNNISTVTVTKVEDMYTAPREALNEVRANITEVTGTDTPNVTIKGEVGQPSDERYKIKKVAVWRHVRGTGDLVKRDYQEVNVNADGTWSLKKTFTNNGKYTYSCAPIIDAEPWGTTLFRKTKKVLGTASSTTFEVDAEKNNQRTKRYNPFSRKRPWGKKKSSSSDEGDKKADKKGGDTESGSGSESGSSSSKGGFFSGLKGLLNGDFLPEPSKSEGKSLVQRGKNIVNGDNDLVKALEGKKSESK